MHNRIAELEKQCWSHRVEGALVDGQLHFDTARFAELIVKECLVVINQSNGVGDDDVIKISRDVKKYFGVEE